MPGVVSAEVAMCVRVAEFLASYPFAEATKMIYRRVLLELIGLPDLGELSAARLVEFVSRPQWGSSQRYVALCACRKFLAWKFGSGHGALSARLKRTKAPRQRVLSVGAALELLASFDTSTAKGARDLAIAALALDTGLRVSELCRLEIRYVDLEGRRLQVIVKGGQWRVAVFSAQTAQYISEWLAFRGSLSRALFVSTRSAEGLTVEGLKVIVKAWGKRLGFRLSPHDLRRSFATLSTIFGAPSRVVQVAGGWSDIAMVEHYTREIGIEEITPYLPVGRLRR